MIPRLYNDNAQLFDSFGIGPLTDAISCKVTRDGMMFELEMEYPVTGARFADLIMNRIITASPDQVDEVQPFRIYRIGKNIKGRVKVYARHISYDASGIPILPFTASSATSFAAAVNSSNNRPVWSDFTLSNADVTVSVNYKNETPTSLRSLVSDWQDTYGGELRVNGKTFSLHKNAGQERDVTIRYGVDIIDAQMEENIANVYTGIVTFWKGTSKNSTTHTTSEKVVCGNALDGAGNVIPYMEPIYADEAGVYQRLQIVDLSSYIASEPSKSTLDDKGRQWLRDNPLKEPAVSLRLSYAQIHQTLQQYDIVKVEIPKLGIAVKAKVGKTVWDVLRERYDSVEIGDVRPKLSDDIYDASRLKKGLLPVQRIAPQSITTDKYAPGSVGSTQMADWSVIRGKLGFSSVGTDQIENGTVNEDKLSLEVKQLIAQKITTEELKAMIAEIETLNVSFVNAAGINVADAKAIFLQDTMYQPIQITVQSTSGSTTLYVLASYTL